VKWLSGDGLAAAVAVGAATLVGLGWRGEALLLAFFISASALTQLAGGAEGRRNARQVLANGGVAAAAALAGWWTAAAGALAAATADTWATEIGAFSPTPPRALFSGRDVPRGTSGGITPLGTAGGILGAAALAALAALLRPAGAPLAVAGAGVAGMLADSCLGATGQGVFECPDCGARFERRGITCHRPLTRVRGWAWLDNDGVNLTATVVGAAAAAVAARLFSR